MVVKNRRATQRTLTHVTLKKERVFWETTLGGATILVNSQCVSLESELLIEIPLGWNFYFVHRQDYDRCAKNYTRTQNRRSWHNRTVWSIEHAWEDTRFGSASLGTQAQPSATQLPRKLLITLGKEVFANFANC